MITIDANGARIPALGFGTMGPGDQCARMVEAALAMGYRHLDTATIYGNEESVGEALVKTSTPRDEIFLTTKVWVDSFQADAFDQSVVDSLRRLRTEYVDLLLLHWPSRTVPLADMIASLNSARQRGLARHIGVSNYPTRLLDEAVALSETPLATNQIEYHPFLDQSIVKNALERHGMALTSHSPVSRRANYSVNWARSTARAPFRSASVGWCKQEWLRFRNRAPSRGRQRTWTSSISS